MDTPIATGTRVLIVDDNEFNRAGIALYLQNHSYRTLEAGDMASALEIARREHPDAAVVDIVIPTTDGGKVQSGHSVGIRLVSELKALNPAMAIVVFSAHDNRSDEVLELIRDGVSGIAYLLKGVRPEALLQALQETAGGRNSIQGDMTSSHRKLVQEILDQLTPAERPWVDQAAILMAGLSEREMEVASHMTASQNTQGIAKTLGLSPKTIEVHIGSIYQKLGLDEIDERGSGLRKSGILAKSFMVYRLLNET